MADPRVFTGSIGGHRTQAGIVSRIRLENFMCHSNLEIELGDWVNFVTGQNGSESLFLPASNSHHVQYLVFIPIFPFLDFL